MKRVCTWCMKNLGDVYTKYHEESFTSHAICPECAATLFGEVGMDQAEIFIEGLPEPVMIVDCEGVVLTANSLARTQLGKRLHNIMGFTIGKIIECDHACNPEGCGKTIHCNGCIIRKCVEDTFHTGKSNLNVPAYGEPLGGTNTGSKQRSLLAISTEKVAGVVILKIVNISENGEQPLKFAAIPRLP